MVILVLTDRQTDKTDHSTPCACGGATIEVGMVVAIHNKRVGNVATCIQTCIPTALA